MKPITAEWVRKAEGDVAYRYPGNDATKADAKQTVADCRKVRRTIRQAFGLPT